MSAEARDVPVVEGPLGPGYLREALERVGIPARIEAMDARSLTDGRSGAVVTAISARVASGGAVKERRLVLKAVHDQGGHRAGFADLRFTEIELWLSRVLDGLPPPLSCPTLDVAYHETRAEWWMLMEDVSTGIVPRGTFDERKTSSLLRALASMHARYWGYDDELARLPLSSLEATTRIFAEPTATVARGVTPEGWVKRLTESFTIIGRFLPIFLEVLDPPDAEFYVSLVENREPWLSALAKHPATFIHGDLRRANIAFLRDRISLFDWELATRGPAAADLQWFWLLQFWAYPPPDGKTVADRAPLRQEYLDRLDEELGGRLDRAGFEAAWDLAWLRVLSQLGYILVDPLTNPDHTAEDIQRVGRTSKEAIELARRIYDARVG